MTIRVWPFRSSEDLARAGYKCRGPIVCPLCGSQIVIYQVVGKMPVFLDPETFLLHLIETPAHVHPADLLRDGKSAAAADR